MENSEFHKHDNQQEKNGLYVVTETSTNRHQRLRHAVARMLFRQTHSVCRDLSSNALMTCALLLMNTKY